MADVALYLVLEDEVGDDALELVQVHVHRALGAQHGLEGHQVQPRAVGDDEQPLEQVPVISLYVCMYVCMYVHVNICVCVNMCTSTFANWFECDACFDV